MTTKASSLQIQKSGNITYAFYSKTKSENNKKEYGIYLRRLVPDSYNEIFVRASKDDYISLYERTKEVEIVKTGKNILGFKPLISDNMIYVVYIEKETDVVSRAKVAPSNDYGNTFVKPCTPFGHTDVDYVNLTKEELESSKKEGEIRNFESFDAVLQGREIILFYTNTLGQVIAMIEMGKW